MAIIQEIKRERPHPDWAGALADGRLTRIDHMKVGDRFMSAYNGVQKLVRPHGSHHGVYICVDENGKEDGFAGCAGGLLLEGP